MTTLDSFILGTEGRIELKDSRFYVFPPDELIPSVTTILKCYPKGPQLEDWKVRNGEGNWQQLLKEAGAKGTRVHNGAEDLLRGLTLCFDGYTLEEWKCLMALVQFAIDWKLEPVLIEEVVRGAVSIRKKPDGSKYTYAGSCDLVGYVTNPKTGVRQLAALDWKTSKSLHYTYHMQIAAYAKALKKKVDTCLLVHLGNQTKKGYSVKEVDKEAQEEAFYKFSLATLLWYAEHPKLHLQYSVVPETLQLTQVHE